MNMASHGWGCERYGWHAFEQPLGSQTVLWLMHSAIVVHNIQVQDEWLLYRNAVSDCWTNQLF